MAGDVPRDAGAGKRCPPCAHGRVRVPTAGAGPHRVPAVAGMGVLGAGRGAARRAALAGPFLWFFRRLRVSSN